MPPMQPHQEILSAREIEVLVLITKGLINKEIADKLQIPLRTVEDHIYKTLTELRKVLMFVILFRLFP